MVRSMGAFPHRSQEESVAKLGFLGLGIMGYPMARNLLKAGHDVGLWSHTADKARELAGSASGRFCATPADAADGAECVFLCVGDSKMSEDVILGKNGIATKAKKGAVIADASTVSPSTSRRIGAELSESGTLTFMIGGDKDVFERTRPYFEAMGKQLYYCGGPGMGLHAKLSQNLILSNLLQAFNEGMVLATKAGVDPELMLEVIDNSAAKSGLIAFKAPYVFKRDFSPQFSVKWMDKDIGLMLDSGRELKVPLPLTGLTRQMFQTAIAQGHGDEDICSTIKVLESIVGIEVKSR